MSLKEYRKKRIFSQTPEPRGKRKQSKQPIFVIQAHHARHFHFDLRLEIDQVLKSWAVPKGIPKDATEKRLAVQTEDHPLEYASFAGTIPEGNYGAGIVKIWDKGIYENRSRKKEKDISAATAWREGHITCILHGKKAKGEYTLIKTRRNKQWLLIKKQQ